MSGFLIQIVAPHRLDQAFPIRQNKLSRSMRIEEDPDDKLLGPEFRDDGGGEFTLRVPQHYLKRLCHQILLQTVWPSRFDTLSDMNAAQLEQLRADTAGLSERTKACIATLGNEPICLDREVLAYLRKTGKVHEGAAIDDEDEIDIALVYGAAEFFIAHEALHAIVRSTINDGRWANLTERSEEIEADLYALQHLFGQQNLPLAPVMNMATTSLIERKPEADPTHPADVCRYQQIRAVFGRSAPALFKIADFAAKGELFDDDKDIADFVKEVLDYPLMHATLDPGLCGPDASPYLDAAISDLSLYFDPIIARLQGLGIDDFEDLKEANLRINSAEFERFMGGFERRKWKSQVGKKIAAQYLYYLAIGAEFSNEKTANLDDAIGDGKSAKAMRSAAASMQNLTRVYRRLGPEWFDRDVRVLIDTGIEGAAIMRNYPSRVSTGQQREILRQYSAAIDKVILRNGFDLVSYLQAVAYYDKLSPAVSKSYFARADEVRFLVKTYTQGELSGGSCSDTKLLAGTLMNRIAKQVPGAEALDRAGCEDIKAGRTED